MTEDKRIYAAATSSNLGALESGFLGRLVDVTDIVNAVFDLAVGSMDFGSGFLDDEEVINLRQLARYLGRDPADGTPRSWETLSGAVRVERDHATQIVPDRSGTGNAKSVCLCGWVGPVRTPGLVVTLGPIANSRAFSAQLAADGASHVAEMLEQAKVER